MKKLIPFTLLFIIPFGINTLKAQCWHEITVNWAGDCVYPDDKTVYVVNLTIINDCTTPSQTIFNVTQPLTTNNTSYLFCIPNQLCTIDQQEPCFKITATCAKVLTDTQEIVCRDQIPFYRNCEGLKDLTSINLTLE